MKKIVLFGMLAMLSACNSNRSTAEDAVRERLKDPESAKFSEFSYNEETKKGCLTVNAKNSMGGYTGEQQAYLKMVDGQWFVSSIDADPVSLCRTIQDYVKK